MTNFQKAFCIVLSMCFFTVLAVLPGTLFTGENVYRHLPLYRFLEKKAQIYPYEDRETYEKIAGENGRYLGEQAQSEQKTARLGEKNETKETEENQKEKITAKSTPTAAPEKKIKTSKSSKSRKGTEISPTPQISTSLSEEPEIHNSIYNSNSDSTTETMAGAGNASTGNASTGNASTGNASIGNASPGNTSVLPHPAIDLSPAKLADYDYLLGQFYIIDSNTETNSYQINAENFLQQDFTISKDTDTPQILIYHSHSQETFADSREGKTEDTIVGVGHYLAQLLTEIYGYQVMHVTEAFDLAGGELDRSKAYDYARAWLEPVLEENPSIQILIDLHRDGVPEDRHLVTEINGKPTAQIMFYNGLSHTINSGDLSYLPNPYIQDNLAFSFQLEYQAALYYPELYRGIYLAGLRYNLHLRPRALLLEAGAQTNTVQEVKNAMDPFADILNRVMQGEN